MSKVSVIVPIYNAEKFLSKCIDSILSQTFTDFELLLIVDGSPDNSLEICNEYAQKDRRIRVILKDNGGVSSARNIGIENANSDYICFVDSDDIVNESYIQNLYSTDVDLLINGIYTKNYWDNTLGTPLCSTQNGKYNIHNVDYGELINTKMHYYCVSKLFKSSIIRNNNISFDQTISICEDTKFVMDYLIRCKNIKIKNTCDYTYLKYDSENTLSSKFYLDRVDIQEQSVSNIKEKLNLVTKQDSSLQIRNSYMSCYEKNINYCLINKELSILQKRNFLKKVIKKRKYREIVKDIGAIYPNMSKWLQLVYRIKSPILFIVISYLVNYRKA